MASSASGRVIDRVIGSGVADWFREAGFTRRGRSFCRRRGELIHTSHVQASWLNHPEEARFAVNLGVEWPQWHRVWTGLDPAANPAMAPAFVQARLNPTGEPNGDHWWAANPGTRPETVAAEVVSALQAYAGKFWSRYSDLAFVLECLDAGRPVPTGTNHRLVHAALLVRAERSAEAKIVIGEAARRAPKAAGAGILQVAERLGL